MKLANKELFDTSELMNYVNKFETKITCSTNEIERIKADIEKLDIEIDSLIEKDILSDTDEYKKELSNARARRANLVTLHEEEVNKLNKIAEIMKEGVVKIVPELKKRIDQDLSVYSKTVERHIFKELMEIREKQTELFLTLIAARRTVIKDLRDYDVICKGFGLKEYARELTDSSFHNNMFYPNRSCPEFGAPLLNIHMVTATEEVALRARAEAYGIYNRDRSREECRPLPPSKKLSDIDIEKFLADIEAE